MSESDELASMRDKALRKIGRNVVNLQKMEGMLKVLVNAGSFAASFVDLERSALQRTKSVSRQPMGQLVSKFLEIAYSSSEHSPVQGDSNRDGSISFTFRLESDSDLAAAHKKALMSVVEERNSLIHKRLLNFDPNSLVSSRKLCEDLDSQHERMWPEFEALASIVKMLRETQKELLEYVESAEFISDLELAKNDA